MRRENRHSVKWLMLSNFCQCNDAVIASGGRGGEASSELEYASEDKEEEFRTPPPDLMMLVIEGHTPQGMFPVTINLMRVTDNILVLGRPNSEGGSRISPIKEEVSSLSSVQ